MSSFDKIPGLKQIVKSKIKDHQKNTLGYHITLFNHSDQALAGGCHQNSEKALKIAISEMVERQTFLNLIQSNSTEYSLQNYPSTCGFAAGFHSHSTQLRSIKEAIERWAWSQWIDKKFFIPQYSIDSKTLSPIGKFFYSHFDEVIFYHQKFDFFFQQQQTQAIIGIVLGIKDQGIFPGSRVILSSDDKLWEHGLFEAWRHLRIFLINKHPQDIIDKRIHFFGTNKSRAFEQIPKTNSKEWPNPIIDFSKEVPCDTPSMYVWRSLCHDYQCWTKGSVVRFVY